MIKFLNILIYLTLIELVRCAGMLYQSPCPNVFQYGLDNQDELIGMIEIPYPNTNEVRLHIELSVGNRIQGSNGHVEIATNKEKTIEDVMNKRRIRYNLRFPYWETVPPKVTKIAVNSFKICSGNPIDIKSVPIMTVVNLHHTLTLKLLNLPSTTLNTRLPIFDGDTRNYPTTSSSTTSMNSFNINFNPQPPKDPSKIYNNNNGFVNTLTSTSVPLTYEEPIYVNNFDDNYKFPYTKNPFFNGNTQVLLPSQPSEVPPEPASPPPAPTFNYYGNNNNRQPYRKVCGRLGGNGLVVNGDRVLPGSYPWLVAIYRTTSIGLEFTCGGTLISDRHVVSAAHCIRTETKDLKAKDVVLTLGRNNIMNWAQNEALISNVDSIIIHPDYIYTSNNMTADADIVILRMKARIKNFTRFIKPICLWVGGSNINEIVGQNGVVVGWGRDEAGSITTEEPKQVVMPIVSQRTCTASHVTFRDITSDRTFCAGNRNGVGPCNGDSGGGFALRKDNLWTLRGVVSMSILDQETRCDLNNYFVFTDVAKFTDWLLLYMYQD